MHFAALASRRPIFRSLAVMAITPFLALNACGISSSSATTTLTSTVAGGKSATITTENGKIEVIKDPAVTGVQISAEIRCYGKDQAEADARLKATTLVADSDANGEVAISVNAPKRAGGSWINMNSDVMNITVRAADLSGIVATTSNGSITIGAFAGNARLETSNGRITVEGHKGPIDALTSNGSIDITGASAAKAETSNGRITVSLADDATGDLVLKTSNGSVTLDLPEAWQGTVSAETSLGSVNLSGGTVAGKGESKTMKVGDASKATATIETSLGSVTVRQAKK
ncbi:MAG: hypothetical protein RLY21_344 [Planctomycetota bacterium]|jgi:hypothetical protein